MLSNAGIVDAIMTGDLEIDPWKPDNLQPASYDLTLACDFAVLRQEIWKPIRLDESNDSRFQRLLHEEFTLMPGQFALARTEERVKLNHWLAARVEGRSSMGRLGQMVHATAGFIDPGFNGTITLELYNLGIAPIILKAGRRIAQLSIFRLDSPAETVYESEKYQGQVGVRFSRIHLDREVVDGQATVPENVGTGRDGTGTGTGTSCT